MGKRGNCSSAPPARGLLADGNAAAAGLLYPLPAAWKEPSKGFFFWGKRAVITWVGLGLFPTLPCSPARRSPSQIFTIQPLFW